MNTPHKYAEVIHAWADGKKIQVKVSAWTDWTTYNNTFKVVPDFSNECYEWRIKPEVKTGWINIYSNMTSDLYATKESANDGCSVNRIACIQISYTEGEGL